jgi:prepilin-type N-terminal cleavage/methylation domain-containing protein
MRNPDSLRRYGRPAGGFTLIEMVVVAAVLLILMMIGLPVLTRALHRYQLEGAAREISVLLRGARFEAVKTGGAGSGSGATRTWASRTVVRFDPAAGEAVAFVDLHDAAGQRASDLRFNPVAGAAAGTTDHVVGRVRLPTRVRLWGPGDPEPGGAGAFAGLTVDPADGATRLVAFTSDGAVEEAGALRLGDGRGNFLEVRVGPRATARVDILKWDDAEGAWLAAREGGKPWTWN